MQRVLGLVLVALVGCGGGNNNGKDAGDDDGIDGSNGSDHLDAGVDAPDFEAKLALGSGDIGLGGITFDGTRVGSSQTVSFSVTNTGTLATGTIVAATTGDAAFSVAASSDCQGATLAPSDTCTVSVVFAPAIVGPHTGTLDITASPGGLLTLDLAGDGDDLGIVFDPDSVDFGTLTPGTHTQVVHVTNSGTDTLPITSISINGPIYSETTDCGASLAGGASCDVTIAMTSSSLGEKNATLTLDSDSHLASAPVTGVTGGSVTVVKAGGGTGTVTSDIGGVDCGATCSTITAEEIVLTATPDSGSSFLGWSDPTCGASTTCTVAADAAAQTLTATFVDDSATSVNVHFAGNATGFALAEILTVDDRLTFTCASDCTIPVTPGDVVTMVAGSPSDFGGWSGDCTSATDPDCSFVVTADADVTVTYNKGPEETFTRLFLPGVTLRSVASDSTNRWVVGSTAGVIALDAAGATRWTVATLPDPANPLLTVPASGRAYLSADDDIYVVHDNVLGKLDIDGNVIWTIDVGADSDTSNTRMAHPFAVSPFNGDVAVLVGSTVKVFTDAGALDWSASITNQEANALAIDLDGNVDVLSDAGGPQNVVRFDASGATLTAPSIHVSPQLVGSLAIDSTGAFVTSSFGANKINVQSTSAAGAQVFLNKVTFTGTSLENGVAVDDDDAIFEVCRHPFVSGAGGDGFLTRGFSPTGTITWTFDRTPYLTQSDFLTSGIDLRDIAADHDGNVAFVGRFVLGDNTTQAVIQVYTP